MDMRGLALSQGLSEQEWERIVEALGRMPTEAEVAVFSAMWNEHVSYKTSRLYLRRFPTKGPRVLVGPGENAGVVDLGGGIAACFKMESHNHPSYIEPFQGAATGVGGILRDIFTMGARPIALMDSLRFGAPSHPRTAYLVGGVVAGIAHYGNCMGVPTVAGELVYDEAYNFNCLVNVFCLGIAPVDKIFFGRASVPGSIVIYAGSSTGRDGIHGATMASSAFEDNAAEKRPTVQVGDPFAEKCLLEACLELMERGLILGIQDMGAAGLTCSTFEMAARGKTGMKIDLGKVPLRAASMTPPEILLSESQERMTMVTVPGLERAVLGVLERWDVPCAVIGEVTGSGRMEMFWHGDKVVDLPISLLTDEAPVYNRPWQEPSDLEARWRFERPRSKEVWEAFLDLLDDFSFRSCAPVYEQYDHMVQVRTVVGPGEGDAAVLRLLEAEPRGVAVVVDGAGAQTWLDPKIGAFNIVAEAVLNLACVGARAIGLTDCLNFGNPERPEVMWEFREAVEGLALACEAFGVPVTGGNVSFYNETSGKSIFPTPVVGVVGVVEDVSKVVRSGFVAPGDAIVLLGPASADLASSLYLRRRIGAPRGRPKIAEPRLHSSLCELLVGCIQAGILHSAHDVSQGGLLFALAECIATSRSRLGVFVDVSFASDDPEAFLFGEAPSRVLVSLPQENMPLLERACAEHRVPMTFLGFVGGSTMRVDPYFSTPVETIISRHLASLPGL